LSSSGARPGHTLTSVSELCTVIAQYPAITNEYIAGKGNPLGLPTSGREPDRSLVAGYGVAMALCGFGITASSHSREANSVDSQDCTPISCADSRDAQLSGIV
jgi:hypothetical protein